MCRFPLLVVVVTLLTGSIAQAASYLKTDGTIVDPIRGTGGYSGGVHSYSGNDLEPGAVLNNVHLGMAKLEYADLNSADLTGAMLISAILLRANLTDANLTDAWLATAVLFEANLTGANLTGAQMPGAFLSGANLTGANLTNVSSGGIDGTPNALPTNWQLTSGYLIGPGANLSAGADLTGADLNSANLTDANLTDANLTDATLTGANLNSANLTDATLASANLTSATLTGADLNSANLTSATLTGADLNSANLTDADLVGANLTNVSSGGITGTPNALPINWQLTSGYLIGPEANLTAANLNSVNLTNANLTAANLNSADLTGANLHQALLPSAMPILPVVNGAVVTVASPLAVSGSIQVDSGGNLLVTSDTFTTTGIDMQGGKIQAAMFGLDLDEIDNISGHGRLFGDVDLGTDGVIEGSGTGLELFGHLSGSGTISGATLFGNLDIGSSPGVITLEDVAISDSATTTFEITGTDPSQFDRLVLLGTVALAGTAQITFDNFAPDLTDTFQLIDLAGGTASSWFSSVAAPEGWTLSSSGTLSAIPEPATLLLAVMSLGGLFFGRGQPFLRG